MIPCAVIPCRTAQQARKLAAFWNMTEEEQIDELAYGETWKYCGFKSRAVARAVLAAITGGRT